MIFNVLQLFVLIVFTVLSCGILMHERKTRLGIIVKEENKVLSDGKQGLETLIGRSFLSDVHIIEQSVSRIQAIARYNTKEDRFETDEYGKPANKTMGYHICGHSLSFILPSEPHAFEYGYIPVLCAFSFICLQMMATYAQWHVVISIIPHLLLLAFLVFAYCTRSDKHPITECVMAIMLTYYIEATLYPAQSDSTLTNNSFNSAIMGVGIYIMCCMLMKFFLQFFPLNSSTQNVLRIIAATSIIALIVMNILFADNINGAYNWVAIGPISFQPSEVIKVLFGFVLIVPVSKKFYSLDNLLLILGIPMICLLYGLIIKDIGVLLQFGVMFAVAVIIQNSNILHSVLIIVAGVFGCKVVLRISSTAAERVAGWLGESGNILDSLTASGIFEDPMDYGYQSVHSLIAAFKNGGLFGNDSFDVLEGITATNSDLVVGFIGQKHGCLIVYMLLAIYALLILNTLFNMRQQKKMQQTFSVLGITLMTFAFALNFCGTFGIVALTGVVSPALSDGMSSAISYGCLFGVISSSNMSKTYLKKIKGGN